MVTTRLWVDVQEHESDSDNDDDDVAAEGTQSSAPVQSFATRLAAADDDVPELVGMLGKSTCANSAHVSDGV